MSASLLTLALLTGAAAPAKVADRVAGYSQVAVMPLSSLGTTEEAAQVLERILVSELARIAGARLIPPNELATKGKAARAAIGECEGVVVCLVEVVGALGWDAFVVGNVAGLGDDRVINLKLIDVRTGAEVSRTSAKASGSESELIKQVRIAAVSLLAPHQLTGTLDLKCEQPGVRITLDGQLIGTTPLGKTKHPVEVGRHAIEATGDGLVPFQLLVDVGFAEDKRIDIKLPENTVFLGGDTPFRSRWWTWALGGVGLVGVGLGGYFNYLQADTSRRIERRAERGTLTSEHAELYDDEAAYWRQAQIFYGAGGAMLATVSVLWIADLF